MSGKAGAGFLVAAVAGCILVASVAGYLVGKGRLPGAQPGAFPVFPQSSNVTMHSCMAYSTELQVGSQCADGEVYNIPIDNTMWTDSSGTVHEGGRPVCLPPTDAMVGPIKFATSDVKVGGLEYYPVVWVWC